MAGQVAEKSALVSSLEASERRLSEELLQQRVAFDRQLKDFREAKEANSELVAELDNERALAKAMAGQVAEKFAPPSAPLPSPDRANGCRGVPPGRASCRGRRVSADKQQV